MQIQKTEKHNIKDMTNGTVWKQLLLFTLPLLMGMVVQSLYNVVDAVIVGRVVGKTALAAVGCSGNVTNFLMAVFMGISVGAGVVISQYFGAKDFERLKSGIHVSIFVAIIIGIITTFAGILLTPWMLTMLNTPTGDGTYDLARTYLMVIFLGTLGSTLYNITSGIIRSLGDSKTPLYILIVCNITNLILATLFVAVFHWGVAGAGIATILSQSLSAVMGLVKLSKMPEFCRLELKKIHYEREIGTRILKNGIPIGVQMGIMTFGMLILQGFVNSFGSSTMAGFASATRVDGLLVMPVPALGTAVLTFVGQNVGAGNSGRVTKGIKAGLVMDVAYALLLIPVLLLGGRYFLGVFTNDQAVVEAGYKMLFTLAPFYWMMAIQNLLSNAFKGAGCATISVVISIFTCFFGRIVIGSILIWLLKDVVAVYYGIVSDFFLAMALNIIVFKVGKWRKTAYGERSISYRQEVLPEN